MKGFKQGLVTVSTHVNTNNHLWSRRYISTLKGLSKNSNIIITPSDKDGCVVIKDSLQYNKTLTELLKHTGINYITNTGTNYTTNTWE